MRMSRLRGPIFAGLFLLGCFIASPPEPAAAQQAAPPPAVTVAPVTSQLVGEERTFTGRVSAVEKIEIEPRVAGFVDKAGYDSLSAKMEPIYGAVSNDEQYVPTRFAGAVKGLSTGL